MEEKENLAGSLCHSSETARHRVLTGPAEWLFCLMSAAGVVTSVFYLFRASFFGYVMMDIGYYFLLLAIFFPWVFILLPMKKDDFNRIPYYDVTASIASFVILFYLFLSAEKMSVAGWEVILPLHVFILGLGFWLLLLEASRRCAGLSFMIIVTVLSIYPLFAFMMPGLFKGAKIGLMRLIGFHIIGPEGLTGPLVKAYAELLIGFIVFGAALIVTGGGNFLLDLALCGVGRFRGGPAKVGIVGGALFGMISGASIPNLFVVGSMTIPAMKSIGYPGHYAAAIQACASVGGMIMPPVMGIVAFVMASFLNIPYASVCIMAAVPAFLYFLGLFIQADSFAGKMAMKGLPQEQLPQVTMILKEGWLYLLAIAALLYTLFVLRLEARAGYYATALLLVGAVIRKKGRLSLRGGASFLESTGGMLAELAALLGAAGIMVGGLFVTGIAYSLTREIIVLAGGNIYLLAIFGAISAFVLGTGVPVVAVYILLAILLAPTFVQAGFNLYASHLFVLYWGVLADITPPTCITVFAAANLAQVPSMRTGITASRLGMILYFIPFFFLFEPSLVMVGSALKIVLSVMTAILGVIIMSYAIEGYAPLFGKLGYLIRLLLLCSGLLLIIPKFMADAIGLTIPILLVGHKLLWGKWSSKNEGLLTG